MGLNGDKCVYTRDSQHTNRDTWNGFSQHTTAAFVRFDDVEFSSGRPAISDKATKKGLTHFPPTD
tara:strand:- start:272 stop:466 length:195 start_codon:yes stop_codon:yes gene_type:complete